MLVLVMTVCVCGLTSVISPFVEKKWFLRFGPLLALLVVMVLVMVAFLALAVRPGS